MGASNPIDLSAVAGRAAATNPTSLRLTAERGRETIELARVANEAYREALYVPGVVVETLHPLRDAVVRTEATKAVALEIYFYAREAADAAKATG